MVSARKGSSHWGSVRCWIPRRGKPPGELRASPGAEPGRGRRRLRAAQVAEPGGGGASSPSPGPAEGGVEVALKGAGATRGEDGALGQGAGGGSAGGVGGGGGGRRLLGSATRKDPGGRNRIEIPERDRNFYGARWRGSVGRNGGGSELGSLGSGNQPAKTSSQRRPEGPREPPQGSSKEARACGERELVA